MLHRESGFRLLDLDKKVILSFSRKERMEGKILETDGKSLFKRGLIVNEKVAVWRGPWVILKFTNSVSSDDVIVRFLSKIVGKKKVFWEGVGTLKFHSFGDVIGEEWKGLIVATLKTPIPSTDPKWEDHEAGKLFWSKWKKEYSISMVEVRPDLKRTGVATEMYRHLFKREGISAKNLSVGYRTEEGHQFRKNVRLGFKNSFFCE